MSKEKEVVEASEALAEEIMKHERDCAATRRCVMEKAIKRVKEAHNTLFWAAHDLRSANRSLHDMDDSAAAIEGVAESVECLKRRLERKLQVMRDMGLAGD